MKKLIAILCLLALCLPLIACSSELAVTESATAETQTKEETKKTEEAEKDTSPITYPKGFSVGFGRGDISSTPLPMYEATAETVHDPIMLTCTALCDGENVALIMSADLKGIAEHVATRAMEIIEKEFGIPAENVMINTTHTHSACTAGGNSAEMLRFLGIFYKQVSIVTEEALRDLDEAEAYIGVSHTDGITFVRRYLLPNGKYQTNPSGEVTAHETDADNELRTLRFDRKNKKDVLLVNYQTHYGGATGMYPAQVSADFITPFRDTAEDELDCHFAYQSGASGNLNFKSNIPGERKYATFIDAIDGFMETTRDALSGEEKAEVGTIRSTASRYACKVIHDSEERVKQAKEIASAPENQKAALCNQYGFASKREANAVVTRAGYAETQELPLSCITCGDLAFTAFPYEMFDQNGKEVREGSPYKMTFICSLTNGGYGYIPTTFAFPHGGYEVYVTRFVQGTGEELVAEMLRLLGECKNAA